MTGPTATRVELRDVTLRDGLQLAGKPLPVSRRIDVARALLRLGVPAVEIGSMARSDLVPSAAGTLDVVAALTPAELARCWVWVATPRHVERALAAGAVNLQYCVSASDEHNQANLGRSTDASVAGLPAATALVQAAGGRIQLCVATAFTCPFTGPVAVERVLAIVQDPRAHGTELVVCDTLGQARPTEVTALLTRLRVVGPDRRTTFHGHDTWGQGVANSFAAVAAGADAVDGCLGGLGGCPFAPGASGNAATEDLAFALRPHWLTPPALAGMVELSGALLAELGEPNRSRTAEAARVPSSVFRWSAEPGRCSSSPPGGHPCTT